MRRTGQAVAATLIALPMLAGAANPERGAQLYSHHCAGCHGADGRPAFAGAPDFRRLGPLMKSDLALLASVRGGRGAMPAYQAVLRDRDILDLIAHLRTLP